jgi:aerotaxis receptor
VRVKPKSEERQRAERLYKNINAGMSRPFSKSISIKSALFSVNVLSALVIGAVAIKTGAAVMPIIATSSVLLAIGFAVARVVFGQLDKAAEKSKAVAENLVSQYVYTGRTDNLGQIIFGGYMLEARLRTIVGRMTESFTALHWN